MEEEGPGTKEDEVNENRGSKKTCLKRHLIFLHESFRVFFYRPPFLGSSFPSRFGAARQPADSPSSLHG